MHHIGGAYGAARDKFAAVQTIVGRKLSELMTRGRAAVSRGAQTGPAPHADQDELTPADPFQGAQ